MSESLQHRYDQLQSLADTGGTLSATLEFREVVEAICRESLQVLQADAVSVLHPGYDKTGWRILASRGLSEAYVAEALIPETFIRKHTQGQPRPVIYFDDLHGALPERAEAYRREGIHAALLALMRHQDEPVGALVVYSKTPGRQFAPEDHATALTLAEMAAAALANARLYAQAQNRLGHLQALREIDLAILSSVKLPDTLETLIEQVVTQLQVDAAAVWLVEGEPPSLNLATAHGMDAATTLHLNLGAGGSPDPLAGLPAQGLLVPDPGSGEPNATIRVSGMEPFGSALLIPLRTNDRVLGLLGLFHRSRLTPDREWLDFAASVGGQTAIAVDRAGLFEDLKQANADLIVSYDATLEGWSRALDLRDDETSGHTERVTEGTLRLATAMGLGADDLTHIRRGALLHDVGKLGIPDRILLKPGPLTDAEWVIMKQHPVMAYEWLRPISFLKPALDIPYCHHEKWDGTGYPRGLRGEAIPLAARIFAVVDVWDALCSDRPYRPAWSTERVREYIRSQAGSHFDPDVVDVFLRLA